MELPKFHETFNPILDILSNGKAIHHRELLNLVVDKYYSKLPEALLEERTKSGEKLILNRIAWGKSYLKKGGFIFYPERGVVQITEKGKQAAQKKLQLPDIENETDFLSFILKKKLKSVITVKLKTHHHQDLIDTGFSAIEAQIKNELLDGVKNIDPYYFQKVILLLLAKMGMESLWKHQSQMMAE